MISMYCHLSEFKVSQGQEVSQGQVIALSGGEPGTPGAGVSTGPHLHFGMQLNGEWVDPLLYVSPTNRRPKKKKVKVSESAEAWRDTILQAFAELGYTATDDKVDRIIKQISTESQGNENAIQGIVDSNSGKAISFNGGVCPWCPSDSGKHCGNTNIGHGLLQFIPSTFNNCKISGHGDIFSGYDQICALIVNAETKNSGRYTHIGNGTGWSPK